MKLIIVNTHAEADILQREYDKYEVMVTSLYRPLYGYRFDTIENRVYTEDMTFAQYMQYDVWLNEAVRCRLEPDGKWE